MKALLVLIALIPTLLYGQTLSWDDPIVVNDDVTRGNTRPKIALNAKGEPIVMWGRANNREIYVSTAEDGSFPKPLMVTPTGVNAFVQTWAGPGMDARGDTVFVSFKAQPEDEGRVYLVRSIDGGKTFGDTLRVSDNNWSRFPEVSIGPGGHPAVTYMEFEPDFKEPHYTVAVSDDGGMSFTKPVSATANVPGDEVCDCCPGFILREGKNIYVMFRNNDNDLRDIWVSTSNDNGKSFINARDIDTNNWVIGGCPSTGPEANMIGDSLVAVWMSGASGSSRVNVASIHTSTLNVGYTSELNPGASVNQNYPKIAGTKFFTAVVWQEIESGSRNIKMTWSLKGIPGLVNNTPTQVNVNDLGVQQSPDIIFDDKNEYLHVVWQDLTARKVMYRRAKLNTSSVQDANFSLSTIEVFPNPSSGAITIKLPQYNANGDHIHLVLSDLNGVKHINETLGHTKEELQLDGLAPGIYILQVTQSGVTQQKKLVIQ